jgi:HlyD family secretion protein
MDRPLDETFRKQQITKRLVQGSIALAVVVVFFIWAPGWISPSVSRNRIRTAKVDRGPIEATISASGTVVPEFEQVIPSPIETRVLKILQRPGAVLKKGEPILELDASAATLALEKLNDQIALKENQQARLKIDLEKTLNDLQTQLQIKKLRLEFLQSKTEQQQKLFEIGGSSKEQLRQTKLEEDIAGLELQQLEISIRNTRQSLQNQLEGVATELKILQDERAEAKHQLDLAGTKAGRDGVLTWAVSAEGATIRQGEVIAKIADLNAFRVDATVSDVHATRLAVGLPVKVKINQDYLVGAVTSILPTIQNGIITLNVSLEDKSSRLLRSQLRVDVYIIIAQKDRVLRLKKGQFVTGEGSHEVFVIRDGVAYKTPVRIGLASFEHYEIVEGLSEGDEVIVSDMQDFIHMKEVKVKQQ